jgi:EpsI family protein
MMLGKTKKFFLIGILMVCASVSAEYLKPTKKLADALPAISLQKMIPVQFGEWAEDKSELGQIVDPNSSSALGKIYGQTLTRNYFNSQGYRIMLSIAYGGDQSKEFEVHRPEVCYTANGFQVLKNVQDVLTTKFGLLPVKRLLTVQGNRSEPITYWIMVGDEAAIGIKVKLAQIRYGLTGTVPDGMLVRVSSISTDEKTAYPVQDNFIREMLAAMTKEDRIRMTGQTEG